MMSDKDSVLLLFGGVLSILVSLFQIVLLMYLEVGADINQRGSGLWAISIALGIMGLVAFIIGLIKPKENKDVK